MVSCASPGWHWQLPRLQHVLSHMALGDSYSKLIHMLQAPCPGLNMGVPCKLSMPCMVVLTQLGVGWSLTATGSVPAAMLMTGREWSLVSGQGMYVHAYVT